MCSWCGCGADRPAQCPELTSQACTRPGAQERGSGCPCLLRTWWTSEGTLGPVAVEAAGRRARHQEGVDHEERLPILCAPPTSPAPPGEWEEWKRPDFLPTQRAPWVTGIPWPAHAFSHGDFFSGSFPMGQSTAINQHTLDSIPTRDKLVPKLKKKKKKLLPRTLLPAPGGQLRVQPEASTPLATELSRVYRSVWAATAGQTPVTSEWFSRRQGGASSPSHPTPPCRCTAGSVSGQSRPPAPPPAVLHGGLHT